MFNYLKTSFLMLLTLTVITGLFYPLITTLFGQIIFSYKANGSLLTHQNKIIGSELIGQGFSSPKYFHPRLSEINYDSSKSGASNLGPTNKKLIERIKASWKTLKQENTKSPVPVDLITSSASGLDPHISPEAAFFQAPRIAKARKVSEEKIQELITKNIEPRQFGILGEPRINVLNLNLKLDKLNSKSN